MNSKVKRNSIIVENSPDIPGLAFRNFRGPEDFPTMSALVEASNKADQIKEGISIEQLENRYANNSKADPQKDVLFAEVVGEAVAYCHVFWDDEHEGPHVYFLSGFVRPEWRHKGLGRSMFAYNEKRIREIASGHPGEREKVLHGWAADTELGTNALFQKAGYAPIRYFFLMLEIWIKPFRCQKCQMVWKCVRQIKVNFAQSSRQWAKLSATIGGILSQRKKAISVG